MVGRLGLQTLIANLELDVCSDLCRGDLLQRAGLDDRQLVTAILLTELRFAFTGRKRGFTARQSPGLTDGPKGIPKVIDVILALLGALVARM